MKGIGGAEVKAVSKRVTDEANHNRACRSRHYSLSCRGQKEMHPIYVSQDASRAAQYGAICGSGGHYADGVRLATRSA
jgi:hypothetical protein